MTSMYSTGLDNRYSIFELIKDRTYLVNLFIMVLAWSASSFCFYILGFYIKYIPGDVFFNIIVTCVADAVSSITAGFIAGSLGTQKTLLGSFFMAGLSGFGLIFFTEPIYIMIFMLLTKFGINVCFTLCYIINAEYFPAVVCSRVFGICNIFSRISTVLAPLIAEISPPIPMVVYIFICFVSMAASAFLRRNEEVDAAMADIDDTMSC